MATPFDEADALLEAARRLQGRAQAVQESLSRAGAALDRADYSCQAAARHRHQLALIAGRLHRHGGALDELAATMLRQALTMSASP